jgi:hypothetical protein
MDECETVSKANETRARCRKGGLQASAADLLQHRKRRDRDPFAQADEDVQILSLLIAKSRGRPLPSNSAQTSDRNGYG